MREVVFDTETTGLSHKEGDRVIEIGALELRNGFPTGRRYHVLIDPEGRTVHPDALAIHGIGDEQLRGKPTFRDILPEFQAFFAEGNLVAHNAAFDIGFLNSELERAGAAPFEPERVVDTLAIARRKFPGARNTLDGLCARFGIDTSARDLHGALIDTELLAQVYLELTGGRQAGFALGGEAAYGRSAPGERGASRHPPQRQRPTPLPPRLTEVERAAHRAFMDEIGPDTLWHRIWAAEATDDAADPMADAPAAPRLAAGGR